MIRIAIVDDDKKYCDELTSYLKRYEETIDDNIAITVYTDGSDIVRDYRKDYDIILMDVEMADMDGMTAAEHIRKTDADVVIIFITNMPQYAINGYKVDALDYVLKPISYFAFTQRIDRALSRRQNHRFKYISLPIAGGMKKVEIDRITYIEVLDHDLVVHLEDCSIQTKGSLGTLEEQLSGEHFFRCNKGYLINLKYVETVQGSDVLVDEDWLQVSRSKKKSLMDAINNYINEVSV